MDQPIQITDNIKLYNGKCEKIIPTLENNSIDLCITSPPYNVDLGHNKSGVKPYDQYNDNKKYKDYISWLKDIFEKLYPKMKVSGRVVINVGDPHNGKIQTHVDVAHFMVNELKYLPMGNIIWEKSHTPNICLPAGEPINTLEGYKNIEDIKIGDYALTHKRRYKKVINTFKNNYTGNIYKIKSYSGEEIIITEGHKLLTFPFERKCGKYKPKKCVSMNYSWISPEKMPKEVYLAIPKYTTYYHASNKSFNNRLKKITGIDIDYYNPDFFRLLGYYIGDGSNHRTEVRIDFSNKQKEYADDVEQICKKYKWTISYEKRKNLIRICIASRKKLHKILEILGGKYSIGKKKNPF